MAESRIPRPPRGLKAAGKALWNEIHSDLPVAEDGTESELDARDLHLLKRACRCADELAVLEKAIDEHGPIVQGSRGQPVVNRAMEEARLTRALEARLLSSLKLVPPDVQESPASQRGRKAAERRWGRAGESGRALRAL